MFDPRLSIVPVALLCCGFVDPLRFADIKTGLGIEPPAGFVLVSAGPQSGESMANIAIGIVPATLRDLNDPPTPYCILALHERPDNAALTRAQLNERMRDPEWIATNRADIEAHFIVMSDEPLQLGDINGHRFIVDDQGYEPGPEDDLVQVISIFDTPPGRVTLNCISIKQDLDADMTVFETIGERIVLPE